jgi:hypothetical protein
LPTQRKSMMLLHSLQKNFDDKYSNCHKYVPFGYVCVCDPQKQLHTLCPRRHIRINENRAAPVDRRPRSRF